MNELDFSDQRTDVTHSIYSSQHSHACEHVTHVHTFTHSLAQACMSAAHSNEFVLTLYLTCRTLGVASSHTNPCSLKE